MSPGLTEDTPARPILPGHPHKPEQVLPFPGVHGLGLFFAGASAGVVLPQFTWVALNRESDPGWLANMVKLCHSFDRACGVWDPRVEFDSAARVAQGWDFYIGQVEGPGQYERVKENLVPFRIAHPDLPAAVVTNFGGMGTAALAEPFIDAGFACIVEVAKSSGHTIAGQLAYAINVLQWPPERVSPLVELDSGATLDDYPGWDFWPGACVFTAEALLG